MRLLLDTHVLLWRHDQPARLTETAYDAVNDLGNDVFISVVTGPSNLPPGGPSDAVSPLSG